MRVGKSPTRKTTTKQELHDITCTMLVHIPNTIGYYEQRIEIFDACIRSMVKNAGVEHNVIVFDNASCTEAADKIDDLQEEGIIDVVVRSRVNIGKPSAMRWLFWIAPGEIIAYSDDDMFFLPGWLDESIKVLEHFPNVGCVSAYPFRPQAQVVENLNVSTLKWAEEHAVVTREDHIPEWWNRLTILGVGRDWNEYVKMSGDLLEYVVEYEGMKALIQGHHCQFIGRRVNLISVPDGGTDKLMGNMLLFDKLMDNMGLLRLNTYGGYAMHVGNIIDPDMFKLMRREGFAVNLGVIRKPPMGSRIIMKMRPLLEPIYEWLYWSLSRTK